MSYDTTESSKRIANYADESMFTAQPTEGIKPRVTLISATPDPLGTIAQLAQMYQGISRRSLEEISDADRQYYFGDGKKNILGMPSEAVTFHFLIENVTRSWTHQLVRTRYASYAQESLRFAVKEDFPCALPPSLTGSRTRFERATQFARQMGWMSDVNGSISANRWNEALLAVERGRTTLDRWRDEYDDHNDLTQQLYLRWIDEGMPAEDARGVLPHWILTKVNLVINLRSLRNMAGQRLCTQAQFEHREVWNGIIGEIRSYGSKVTYRTNEPIRWTDPSVRSADPKDQDTRKFYPHQPESYTVSEVGDHNGDLAYERSSAWQFEVLAREFQPICYQTGKCQFQSDFDRFCNIRDRVQANAAIGRPSSEWHTEYDEVPNYEIVSGFNGKQIVRTELGVPKFIPSIHPTEWLDPNAAIRPDGNWRSEEAKKNIEGRRL